MPDLDLEAGEGRSSSHVAIHQPNFFPWLGYFVKIVAADVFIFLDNAQIPKKGGSWVNRVRISNDGKAAWMTASVHRPPGGEQRISETRFGSAEWREKCWRILENGYRAAPFYADAMNVILPLLFNEEDLVARYNMHAVRELAAACSLPLKDFRVASQIEVGESGTERLVALVKAVGGNGYLSGDGAAGYQQDALFEEANLGLKQLGFVEQPYKQVAAPGSPLLAGLSIIDSIMNLGFQRTGRVIVAAARKSAASGEFE